MEQIWRSEDAKGMANMMHDVNSVTDTNRLNSPLISVSVCSGSLSFQLQCTCSPSTFTSSSWRIADLATRR